MNEITCFAPFPCMKPFRNPIKLAREMSMTNETKDLSQVELARGLGLSKTRVK